MKIILEGPDCSGKTTLAHTAYGSTHKYSHFGPPKQLEYSERLRSAAWVQYLTEIAQMQIDEETSAEERHADGIHEVIDRFIYGELIYGPIFRDDRKFTVFHKRMLERILLTFPTAVIHCQSDWDTTVGIWRERADREMVKKEDQFREIWEKFQMLSSYVDLPMVEYDFAQESVADLQKKITNELNGKLHVNRGPGIGNWHWGGTLLVGDRVNDNVHTNDYPFVADSGSSLWLAEQLENWKVSERSLYWINSTSISGRPTDGKFVSRLQPKQVVALGNAAAIWCKQNKIKDFWTVAHPAYWKRFNANKPYELEQLLCPTSSTESTASIDAPLETF